MTRIKKVKLTEADNIECKRKAKELFATFINEIAKDRSRKNTRTVWTALYSNRQMAIGLAKLMAHHSRAFFYNKDFCLHEMFHYAGLEIVYQMLALEKFKKARNTKSK